MVRIFFLFLLAWQIASAEQLLKLQPNIVYRNSLHQRVTQIQFENSQRRHLKQLDLNESVIIPDNFTSSSTEIIYADENGYSAMIGLGTPIQDIPLLVDTGSPTLYVKSELCFQCDKFCTNTANGYLFNFSDSTTANLQDGEVFLQYGDGTVVGGFRINDTVTVAGTTIKNVQFMAASGTDDESEFGIIGFSRAQPASDAEHAETSDGELQPQPVYLSAEGNKSRMFSLWFDAPYYNGANGELLLGGIDQSKIANNIEYVPWSFDQTDKLFWTTKMDRFEISGNKGSLTNCSSSKCWVLFDSGTNSIGIPSGLANIVTASFQSSNQTDCSKLGAKLHSKVSQKNSIQHICKTINSMSHEEAIGWMQSHCDFEYDNAEVCPSQDKQERSRSLLAADPCPFKKIIDQYIEEYYQQQSQQQGTGIGTDTGNGKTSIRQSKRHKVNKSMKACELCKLLSQRIIEGYKEDVCPQLQGKNSQRGLKQNIFEGISNALNQTCQQQLNNGDVGTFPCSQTDSGPTLSFKLGSVNITLEPQSYVRQTSNPDECVALITAQDFANSTRGINAEIVLGLPFFKKYYTVFDNGNGGRIGMAESKAYTAEIQGTSRSGSQSTSSSQSMGFTPFYSDSWAKQVIIFIFIIGLTFTFAAGET